MFNKKLKQQVNVLEEKIDDLNKTIVTRELERLRRESIEYKETLDNINKVSLRLEKVALIESQDGEDYIRVAYSVPEIKLLIDDKGNIIPNETFKAINKLNLLNQNDLSILTKKYNKIKQEVLTKQKEL